MKTIFIGAKIRNEPDYEKVARLVNEKIPEKKLAICYSNQFVEIARKLPEFLTEKEVLQKTQVLGCSNPKFKEGVEGIIIVGEGKFHSVSLAYETGLPTYILEEGKIKKITEEEVKKMEEKEKGMYLKYLNSSKVGVLITNKPGQQRMKSALDFTRKIKEKGKKKVYMFIANDLDTHEFENFQIDTWVNTACPRMDLTDGNILNLEKLQNLEKVNSEN